MADSLIQPAVLCRFRILPPLCYFWMQLFLMKQLVLGFGILIACLLILFRLSQFSYLQQEGHPAVWIAFFSLLFFGIGVFLSRRAWTRSRSSAPPSPSPADRFIPDEKQMEKTGISKREFEILHLIKDGLSNQQIAEMLFVSEHTVKKHISNLFFKLDVERRTEAVKRAKELRILE